MLMLPCDLTLFETHLTDFKRLKVFDSAFLGYVAQIKELDNLAEKIVQNHCRYKNVVSKGYLQIIHFFTVKNEMH